MHKTISSLPCLIATLVMTTVVQASDYAIVVHADTPTKGLTSAALKDIFLAEQQSWTDWEKVQILLPKSKSPDYQFLLKEVYEMSETDLSTHWVKLIYQNKIASRPKTFPSAQVTLKVVENRKGAIALVPAKDAKEQEGVKILAIDGKLPGEEGYPLVEKKEDGGRRLQSELEAETIAASYDEQRGGGEGEGAQEESRLDEIESALLDLQVELATGGEAGHDFSQGPLLSLRGFGHVQAAVEDVDSSPTGKSDNFALGGLDLFITSQMSDELSFLNETVFEPTEEGEYVLDVERVIVKYQAAADLNVQAGRFHTTLGYWNENYHHGEWLQTSAGRPALLNFEDEGGVLPVHLVGALIKGRQSFGETAVNYTLEVGNGRGPTPDPPQIVVDANDAKAVNVSLSVAPGSVDGLKVGGGSYRDQIPFNRDPDASAPMHSGIAELIYSAFAVYQQDDWEFLAEYMSIAHNPTEGPSTLSDGYYVQASRRVGAWTPYVRVDGLKIDDDEVYYASTDDRMSVAVGARYNFDTWSALKLQYRNTQVDASGGGDDTERQLLLQWSFAF